MLRTTRVVASAALSLLVVIGLAACGQQLEPKLALREAAVRLADAPSASFTISFDGDPAAAASALANAPGSSMSATDSTLLRRALNSSVTVSYDKAAGGVDGYRASVAASIDGVEGTEIRIIGDTAYVKVPVKRLMSGFGAGASFAQARADAALTVPGLVDAFDGKWVSASVSDLDRLFTASGLSTLTSDLRSSTYRDDVKSSVGSLLLDARVSVASGDPGHLVAAVSTKKVHADVTRLLKAVAPRYADKLDASAPTDQQMVIDFWVDGGHLTAIEVDLAQFDKTIPGRAAIRVDVGAATPLGAPAATKIDLGTLADIVAASQL